MVKIWFITLLLLPALAWGEIQTETDDKELEEVLVHGAEPEESDNDPSNWVDASHHYAIDQAQALTEWMDSFFGDPNYDVEVPESLVRLTSINSWKEDEDFKSKLKVRGKLQLPRLSERLNLVFNAEDSDLLNDDKSDSDDTVGFLYKVAEKKRSRIDLTLGINWNELRPGVRYRNQGPISERYRYRYTQRVEYENDEGFYSTGQVNLDHALADDKLVRWSNRAIYGEETDGVEWRSKLSFRHRLTHSIQEPQLVASYFATVKGVTDPSYTKNYRLGVLLRRQVYRKFLFVELEPSYNWRKKYEEERNGEWAIVVRFEIALSRDLRESRWGTDKPQE